MQTRMSEMIDKKLDETTLRMAGEWADQPRGITPKSTIERFGNVQVLRFDTPGQASDQVPVLFIPSLINRWYVLDLTEETSFVKFLGATQPTFLVDWGYPGAESSHLPMSYYYHTAIRRAVRAVRKATGCEKVNLLGYCVGGTLAYAYACLEPETVGKLVLLTAPLDFTDTGVFGLYAEEFPVEAFREAMDYMPGWLLATSFQFASPLGTWNKLKMFRDKQDDPKFKELFIAMERWIADPVNFPIRAYKELLTDLYNDNRLARNEWTTADGRLVDVTRRTAPALILRAEQDHIAPASCTRLPAADRGPVSEVTVPTGHIGITTGRQGLLAKRAALDFLTRQ